MGPLVFCSFAVLICLYVINMAGASRGSLYRPALTARVFLPVKVKRSGRDHPIPHE
jgi:hypothetical protein